MGVGVSGFQVKSHTITRSFSRSFLEPGRGKAKGYLLGLAMGGTGWSLRSMMIDLPVIFGAVPFGTKAALPEKETTTASSGCAVADPSTSQTVTRSLSIAGLGAVDVAP